jgi:hypothetical protein
MTKIFQDISSSFVRHVSAPMDLNPHFYQIWNHAVLVLLAGVDPTDATWRADHRTPAAARRRPPREDFTPRH